MSKILFILTSHEHMLNGELTGVWLEEHAVPYLAFKQAGHEVVVASMAGGKVPVDPKSIPEFQQALVWQNAINVLADTPAFDTLDVDAFDAVYMPGGHGTVFDMPYNKKLHDLLLRFDATNRIIASVCHAPAVFAGMYKADGTPFIASRNVAAFTDAEERAVHGTEKVPFLLETRLKELGAIHHAAPDFTPNAIQDGRLVTGQNPQSSGAVAQLVLGLL